MLRLKKHWNWLAGAGLLLALLLAFSLSITPAAAQPGMPQQFYGTVTINGGTATAGTAVAAYVNGVLNASTTVDSSSRYGYSPIFNVTGSTGDTVTFLVGGTQAVQTATFQSGGITRLNLSVVTTTLSVSTSAASSIGSTTATLNGNLASMGGFSSVNVFFQYGTTISYGSTTPTQAKTATGAFTAALTGLTPNITYYFRAVAQSGTTTVYGTGLSLLTNPTVLTVNTSAATSITASGATLNGTLIDRGPNSTVNVYFKYGTTGSMTSSTSMQARTTTGAFSAAVTGLLPNTTYYFQAVAVGATTAYGSSLTFPTGVGTLGVTTVSAGSIAASSAVLNGTLTGLGTNSSVSVYFKYGPTTSYGSTTAWQTMTGLGPFTASISGLSASTTYHFQAVAVGSTTVSGADASFATIAGGGGTAPPHQFYGNVYINGSPATAGATIAASVNGMPAASTTTDGSGRYGYTTLFLVPGTASGVITFYVNGSLVPQTTTWVSGGMTRLNLYSTTPTGLTVSTGSASYATTSTATLNGTLSSLGTDTSATVSIEYGTTTSYGSTTTSQSMSSTGAFPGTATGLTLGTTYHYRAKAVGSPSGTTVYGSDATYLHTSGGGSLAVATNTASAGDTVATLNGTLSGLGTDTSATLSFEWGTSTSYGTTVAGIPSSLSAPGTFTTTPALTGLTNDTTYHCRAKAVGSPSGTTVYGSDQPFTPGGTTGRLLGTGATGTYTYIGSPYVRLFKFTASGTGSISQIRVYSLVTGNVKVALYSDSAGAPGSLLNANNTSTACTAGQWTTISLTATPVIINTVYWIGLADEGSGATCYSTANPVTQYYMPIISYSTYTFPASAGTGYSISTGYYVAIAGWSN